MQNGSPPVPKDAYLLGFYGCLFQVGGCFGFAAGAHLNIVDYLRRSGGLRHACRRPFVLRHIRIAFPSDDATLHLETKPILTDLRFGEFGANGGIDLRVAWRGGMRGRRALIRGARFERRGKSGEAEWKRKNESKQSADHSF